ncbi:hypothetical protein DFO68_102186 [Halomonas ventosae]|uniref:Uncharacterized protein n=1 Tax=Halomonas ventosae TaxID=229007 RepID=A0A4R6I237_9GAMM|nr:hypothetical protein DFO68_102186 [Halomonas ventosae]
MIHPLHTGLVLAATLGLAASSAFAFEPAGQDVIYEVL